MNEANFIRTITVIDPDSGEMVELCVFKHDGGGMFAVDSSYVDQVLDDNCIMYDPFEEVVDPENTFATVKLLGL